MGGTVSCFEPGETSTFMHAALDGDPATTQEQLGKKPLLVLHRGLGGLRDSAWHIAAAYGHAEVLEVLYNKLLENKAVVTQRVRQKHGDNSLTPEDAVASAIDVLNVKGQTPLMFACFAAKADCVRKLMKMGADPWIQDQCGGRTALHYAAVQGNADVVRALLEEVSQADVTRRMGSRVIQLVDAKTVSGFAPLHYAAYMKRPGVVKALLDFGATATTLTSVEGVYDLVACPRWTTPLHLAALQGNMDGAKELLQFYLARRESGAVRDLRLCADRADRLPFHVARLKGHTMLAEMLHPMSNLEALFDAEEVEKLGAPKLSVIASKVLKRLLLGLVDSADAKIATLPALEPEGGSPRATRAHSRRGSLGGKGRKARLAGGASSNSLTGIGTELVIQRTSRGMGRVPSSAGMSRASSGGGGAGQQQQDWWAQAVGRGAGDQGSEVNGGEGGGAAAANGGVSTAQAPMLVGVPTPNDMTVVRIGRTSSLLHRIRALGRRSMSRQPSAAGDDMDAMAAGGTATGGASSRSITAAIAAAARGAGDSINGGSLNGGSVYGSSPAAGMSDLLSPFSAMSWGTTAMVASLASQTQCTICLDDAYCLVEVPCLHRLCTSCSRRVVIAITDRPLLCPVCRQTVKGFYAPHDATALVRALNMQPL